MSDGMIHEFLLGFIKIYILQYVEREPLCGKEIHDQLEEFGCKISCGTLYNTFHNFEEKGYLILEDRNVNGKIRKYYRITEEGRQALHTAREKVKELFSVLYE